MKTKSRLALLLCGSALSGTAAANSICEVDYIIQHSWETGAVHRVHLTYNGPETQGWELGWKFPGQEEVDSIFNVTHDQEGQDVTVENVLWNGRLREGSEVKFGFNVRNPSGEVPSEFFLNGEPCGAETPDLDPEDPETPDEPDTPDEPETPDEPPVDDGGDDQTPPDSGEPDDDEGDNDTPDDGDETPDDGDTDPDAGTPDESATWSLDDEMSFLGFVTTKNANTVESHSFGSLSGSVDENGSASLSIDLNTVETGIDIRNQRLRELLFDTAQNPTANVSIDLGENLSEVLGLSAGDVLSLEVPADIQINGETREINTRLRVERLSGQRFLVNSAKPLIITADQFGLQGGVEALREVAGLTSISIAVPVDFALFFETDELPTP